METRFIRPFIYSTGGILLAAALLRFIIAVGNAPALLLADPVLGMPLRSAVLLVGGIELTVALICLFGSKTGLQLGLLAWLSTNFIVYQAGLFSMHCHWQGACLGSLTDPLHLARGTPGIILRLMPLFLLVGSFVALIWFWVGKNRSTRSLAASPSKTVVVNPAPARRNLEALVRTLKISCTACGGHIEFPTNFFGERIPCPHCQASITLQKSKNLKMSCPGCEGHLEFPDHALGQTIPCPHCQEAITLKEPA